ncbi:DUF262 domain-containing protein [Kribbella sp. CA-293567]|uniref:DUF262 domain-containing protein n=1 Tax=Kribbella sp. CA-293567 TaxID=3002436 RepID=UPI0022DCF61A|nr:DUF262 domain-containing protein [Kribbella sp. CA-293567]WBQ04465.1 DUF262 domain-containing protein [Kribbella sp. CA-293567]
MKADALSPRQLFDGKMHYEIPAFQRPYVWNEEDQWAPLWADVVRVAESRVAGGTQAAIPHHFLGAVVYESKPPVVGDVTRHMVIDGQQRTTTLQLMIDAAQAAIAERGHDLLAEDLEELILNKSSAFKGRPERFKLWPSRHDRAAFAQAMDPQAGWTGEHRILAAHEFFSAEARTWLTATPDADGKEPPGTEAERAEALSATLQDGLFLVAINLAGHDDAQLIFETLNDRGTPLLKADLIKNWIFQHGERVGVDIERWPETHWGDFDDDWWRAEINQGRHSRSRIDIFLQYWLTMRLSDEVKTEHVFRVFTEYAAPLMADATETERLLGELRKDADTYRAFVELDEQAAEGAFYSRVIETMELAATSPLLMWMLSENHQVPADQRAVGLNALESWVIRRTLLRLTMKDVNRMMVAILKLLDRSTVATAGDTVRSFLASQTADARVWPTDDAMKADLPTVRLYGNVRQARLRTVLGAVEQMLRTERHEAVGLPPKLEIEHVMPQKWHTYWDPEPKLTPEQAAAREKRINTLGNLTLVTRRLNGSLSHRPWTDREADGLKAGGDANFGKRSLLDKYSLLVLSNDLIRNHVSAWTDAAIDARSVELTEYICDVWPGPPAGVAPIDLTVEVVGSPIGAALQVVSWDDTDLADFAASSTGLTLDFLDHVAVAKPGVLFTGADLEDQGYVVDQISGISGAIARKTYQTYRRSNPPIEFIKADGRWHYRMRTELADRWRAIRNLATPSETVESLPNSQPAAPMWVVHTGKYEPLWRWLRDCEKGEVHLTFSKVEQILGFSLPNSSRDHPPHWYSYEGSAVARAIIDAGWKATHVQLSAETVTLVRSS